MSNRKKKGRQKCGTRRGTRASRNQSRSAASINTRTPASSRNRETDAEDAASELQSKLDPKDPCASVVSAVVHDEHTHLARLLGSLDALGLVSSSWLEYLADTHAATAQMRQALDKLARRKWSTPSSPPGVVWVGIVREDYANNRVGVYFARLSCSVTADADLTLTDSSTYLYRERLAELTSIVEPVVAEFVGSRADAQWTKDHVQFNLSSVMGKPLEGLEKRDRSFDLAATFALVSAAFRAPLRGTVALAYVDEQGDCKALGCDGAIEAKCAGIRHALPSANRVLVAPADGDIARSALPPWIAVDEVRSVRELLDTVLRVEAASFCGRINEPFSSKFFRVFVLVLTLGVGRSSGFDACEEASSLPETPEGEAIIQELPATGELLGRIWRETWRPFAESFRGDARTRYGTVVGTMLACFLGCHTYLVNERLRTEEPLIRTVGALAIVLIVPLAIFVAVRVGGLQFVRFLLWREDVRQERVARAYLNPSTVESAMSPFGATVGAIASVGIPWVAWYVLFVLGFGSRLDGVRFELTWMINLGNLLTIWLAIAFVLVGAIAAMLRRAQPVDREFLISLVTANSLIAFLFAFAFLSPNRGSVEALLALLSVSYCASALWATSRRALLAKRLWSQRIFARWIFLLALVGLILDSVALFFPELPLVVDFAHGADGLVTILQTANKHVNAIAGRPVLQIHTWLLMLSGLACLVCVFVVFNRYRLWHARRPEIAAQD